MNQKSLHLLLGCTLALLANAPITVAPASADAEKTPTATKSLNSIPQGKELTHLKQELQQTIARYKFLSPSVFVMDVDTGDYLSIDGDRIFPAASTIKLPILMAFFEAVDAGKIRLDETLTVTSNSIASGSGTLQYSRGETLTTLETATKMITISDNTATNMIIDRLGGKEYLNQRFRAWGLQHTYIHNRLGDFKGTNKTSSADLVRISGLLAKRQIISADSRAKALDILNATENRKLLAAGLGEGAHIAHKTGNIGFVIGDAGIVEKPNGKLYLIGVFVRRPYNDIRARDFVQQLSHLTYEYMTHSQIGTAPANPSSVNNPSC